MRDACLAAMGITQWQLKNTDVAQAYVTGLPSDFVFILQQSSPEPFDWSASEFCLLEKIIQATGKTREQVGIVAVASAHDLTEVHLPNDSHCIVFGKHLAENLQQKRVILTETLPELQTNADAKRTLWQALKQVLKNHA